ncbi:MAG TPA: hypothetical protein VFX98_13350, partial [Longimicrobiaceae bacterium]|nr:hypothetical protein [Longimicrobiaceae bacterium]
MSRSIVRGAAAVVLLAAAPACAPEGRAGDGKGTQAAADAREGACEIVTRHLSLPAAVEESSGAALSRRHPGLLWTHEDSGNEPELLGIDAEGRLAAAMPVAGARNDDWEDLALGPCAEGDCLYIADVGDNEKGRRHVSLWVVPEPAPGDPTTRPAREYRARFPGGRTPDTEALVVLPGGEVFLVTKGNQGPIELYRWPTPLAAGGVAELERVRELAPEPSQTGDRVTGAGASPDGRWVAVRTYGQLAFFRAAELAGAAGRPALEFDLTPLGEAQ